VSADSPRFRGVRAAGRSLATILVLLPSPASAGPAPNVPSPWAVSAALSAKEGYDSNVFLQDTGVRAGHGSWITTLLPALNGSWKPGSSFQASLSYAPEFALYHDEHAEGYAAHRGNLSLTGTAGDTSWSCAASGVVIDGSDEGLTFTDAWGAPAAGGVPIRERRDAAALRTSASLTQLFGPFWMRPGLSYYHHDFQTQKRSTPGYQNYADRTELAGGIDAGWKALEKASVFLGFREGSQTQEALLGNPLRYDCSLHRAVIGVEGDLSSWASVKVSLGPDWREYGPETPSGFDRTQTVLWSDLSLGLKPSSGDRVNLSYREITQPGFGGRSTYQDRTVDLNWLHPLTKALATGMGLRAYNTDFEKPVMRDDWIFTASAVVSVTGTSGWNAELSYAYDWSRAAYPGMAGREFTRHLVTVGLKFAIAKR
jgi:hypothetical protein